MNDRTFTPWEADHARKMVNVARYLLTIADQRGLTHGEKHYLIQSALHVLRLAQNELHDSQSSTFGNEVSTIEVSDFPF